MPTGLSSPQQSRHLPMGFPSGLHTRLLSEGLEKEWRQPGTVVKPQRAWDRDPPAARSRPLQEPKIPATNQLKACS